MTSGRLETSGDLTIEPGARVIYNSSDGDTDGTLDSYITDNIKLDRTLRGSSDWIFLISPVNTTYNELLSESKSGVNDLWIQGPTGSSVPDASLANTNLFYYDESVSGTEDSGWTTVGGMSSTIPEGEGMIVYPFADDNNDGTVTASEQFPKTIDAVGGANFSPTTDLPVQVTDADSDGDYTDGDGWNLVGNPYLNVIDWDALSKSASLEGAVYIYDSGNNGYLSYNGTEDGGLSKDFEAYGHIAPLQAFFVNVDGSSGSLTVDIVNDQVAGSTVSGDPFLPKSAPTSDDRILTLESSLENTSLSAKVRATFQSGGALGEDKYDALQLQPPGANDDKLGNASFLEMYSMLDDGTGLSINNLPYTLEEATTIPVETTLRGCDGTSPYVGDVTISMHSMRDIPSGWGLMLKDTQTGESFDLRTATQSDLTFTVESSTPASTCEQAGTSSKTSASTSHQESPALPSPEVVTHSTAKDGGTPNTRFQLVIDPDAALPVEFSSVNGRVEEQDAVLEWTTASETNNAGFEVQKKADGTFTSLDGAFVDGAGESDQAQSYSYRVEDLEAGTHTFRLKQVDTDGAATYSDPIEVNVGLAGAYSFKTYPNPVQQQATVQFAVKEKADVTISLYNTLGQQVKTLYRGRVPAEETKRLALDASTLSSGLYFVRMQGSGFTATKRITVVR